METSDITNTVKVETLVQVNSGTKSSKTVPGLKDLKVVVHKLDDLVKEEQTGSANSPVETELKPIITSVRGYNLRSSRPYEEDTDDNDDELKQKRPKGAHPSRSGPSPERLLTHANALINKVSSFVSKPSNKPSNDGTVSNVETSSQTNDQMLPAEMSSSTPVHNKPARTIWCKICIDSFCSIKELNEHHRKDHWIVDCEQCNKKFATQSSLDKHMYLHSDLRLFVRIVVKTSHSKADWSNIRSHTRQNSVICVNTRDAVEVLRKKGTSTDICLVMRIFGSNVPPAHTKIRTRGTEILT